MNLKLGLSLCAALALAGCALNPAPPAADRPPAGVAGGLCDAAPAQGYIGQQASTEVGAAILTASGADLLRWGPPRSAWTMDYRETRVNVRYDDAMTIIEITCG